MKKVITTLLLLFYFLNAKPLAVLQCYKYGELWFNEYMDKYKKIKKIDKNEKIIMKFYGKDKRYAISIDLNGTKAKCYNGKPYSEYHAQIYWCDTKHDMTMATEVYYVYDSAFLDYSGNFLMIRDMYGSKPKVDIYACKGEIKWELFLK